MKKFQIWCGIHNVAIEAETEEAAIQQFEDEHAGLREPFIEYAEV